MSSQEDYEPSQEVGDSQLVLEYKEPRPIREATENANANVDRFVACRAMKVQEV